MSHFTNLGLPAWRWLLAMLAGLALLGCQKSVSLPRAAFVRSINWAGSGVWLKADTHVHTKFSDGNVSLAEVVRRADSFGCNVLAITDHADSDRSATSEDYFLALEKARKTYPQMALLAGLEWNVPPWHGREHAALLIPPGVHERKLLRDFQVLFDDYQKSGRDPSLAVNAVNWLKEHSYGIGGLPVVFYNHPGRKRLAHEAFDKELAGLAAGSEIFVGFEGGPGHQESAPIGAYEGGQPTIDRWDAAVARVGGSWDELLMKQQPIWGALATSDFHSADPLRPDDFWPGQFSETWLYAASPTPQAALEALRCGSFFGAHGHIARNVQLQVATDQLPRPAVAGEAIQVMPGTKVRVSLEMVVPDHDWRGDKNVIDEVELIAVTKNEATAIYRQRPTPGKTALEVEIQVPAGGIAFRARGRRAFADADDLLFYTNPVQVLTFGSSTTPPSPLNIALAGSPLQMASEAATPNRGKMPSFMLLALVGCGSVLVALTDLWRVEAVRRFAGSKANSPLAHTRPFTSTRIPALLLLLLMAAVVAVSIRSLHIVPLPFAEAASRVWDALRQPAGLQAGRWSPAILSIYALIGGLATALLMGRHSSDRRRIAALPMVVAGSMLLSLASQFTQLYTGHTDLWQNQLLHQSLAALVGGTVWIAIAPLFQRKAHKRAASPVEG